MPTTVSPSITVAARVEGFVTAATATGARLPIDTTGLTDWSFCGWVDVESATNFSFLDIATGDAVTTTPERNAARLSIDADGKPTANPPLNTFGSRVPGLTIGQGPVHLAVVVRQDTGDDRLCDAYINGVPVFENSPQTEPAPTSDRLIEGDGVTGADRWANVQWFSRALTASDVSELYLAERGRLGLSAPSTLVMGSFDSLTAFQDAPFWAAMEDASLRPGTHGMRDAIGGSKHGGGSDFSGSVENNYNSTVRQGLRRRALDAASQHYDEVIWLCMYGTNDLVSGVMDPISADWETGRDVIDGMIARDIASATTPAAIRPVLMTIPARGDWYDDWIADGSPSTIAGATTDGSTREIARRLYNADCRANYASRGYDYLVEMSFYSPTGFATMELAASDALTNGANDYYLQDGVHWSAAGGAEMSDSVLVPFLLDPDAYVPALEPGPEPPTGIELEAQIKGKIASSDTNHLLTLPSFTTGTWAVIAVVSDLNPDMWTVSGDNTGAWTLLTELQNGNPHMAVFYKHFSATPDTTLTVNSVEDRGFPADYVLQGFSGSAGAFDGPLATYEAGGNETPSAPGLTTSHADSLLVHVIGVDDDNVADISTVPAGYTNFLAEGTDASSTAMIFSRVVDAGTHAGVTVENSANELDRHFGVTFALRAST